MYARPHNQIDGFMTWRKAINNSPLLLQNNHEQIIRDWKPVDNTTYPLPKRRLIHIVNQTQQLHEACQALQNTSELALDIRTGNQSYYPLIDIILISSYNAVYVIDTISLFNSINATIGTIIENKNKSIIVHGDSVVPLLKLNFGIEIIGLIDLREAFQLIHNDAESFSINSISNAVLKIPFQENPGSNELLTRPLSNDIVEHFVFKISILFNCWSKIKNSIVFIEHEPFPNSKLVALAAPDSLLKETALCAWQRYTNSLSTDLKNVFAIPQQQNLFTKLYNWRDEKARNNDIYPDLILTNDQLQFITRAMPSSIQKLGELFSVNVQLTPEWQSEIVLIVSNKEDNEEENQQTNFVVTFNEQLQNEESVVSDNEGDDSVSEHDTGTAPQNKLVKKKGKISRESSLRKRMKAVFNLLLKLNVTKSEFNSYLDRYPKSLDK